MSSTTRSRRLLNGAAATITAVALVAGCGGSAVTGPDAAGADTAQTETSTTSTDAVPIDAGMSGTETGTATVPGATDTGAAGTGTTGTAKTGTGSTGNGTAGQGAKGGKTGTDTTDSATGASAVERMVANSAIFGGKVACKPATLSEVNIGNVSTLSGVLGELFGPVTPALETFVASQNACGGLNGHKIRFFQADDQGDPSTAGSKVQDMILKNKVLAFVGNIQVLTVDGALPVYKKYGVPVIGSDISHTTWWTNPIFFPQASNQMSVATARCTA